MRFIRNKNYSGAKGTIQVDAHIGTSYDTVRAVYENLHWLEPLAEAITEGGLETILLEEDIDSLEKLNAIIQDANVGDRLEFATDEQGELAETAIQGPFASVGEAIGGVDNTKAMTALRVAQAIETFADTKQNNYDATRDPNASDDSTGGYSPGSVWINTSVSPPESFRCADPAEAAAIWLKTTLTSDEMAAVALSGNSDDLVEGITKLLMTVGERDKLTNIEPGAEVNQNDSEIKTQYENNPDTNAFSDAEKSKLSQIEDEATADQTNAEITNAYNAEVPVVSQGDAEAGISPVVARWTPERVAQAIAALETTGAVALGDLTDVDLTGASPNDLLQFNGSLWVPSISGGGSGGGGMSALHATSNFDLSADDLVYSAAGLTHKLPALPNEGDKCSVWDVDSNAAANPIYIDTQGVTVFGEAVGPTDVYINLNGGRMDFMYNGSTWIFSYVLQSLADIVAASGGMSFSHAIADTALTADTGLYSEAGLVHTLPASPSEGTKCSVYDISDNAGSNAIEIDPGAETIFSTTDHAFINMNGGRMDFLYNGTTWVYSYVVQTIQPSTTVVVRREFSINASHGWGVETGSPPTFDDNYAFMGGFVAMWSCLATGNDKLWSYHNMPADWDGDYSTVELAVTWAPQNTDTGNCYIMCGLSSIADGVDASIQHYEGLMLDAANGSINEAQTSRVFMPNNNGNVVAGQPIQICVQRRGADALDTFTGNMAFLGFTLSYNAEITLTAAVNNNPNILYNEQSGATYTIQASDAGKEVVFANACTVTLDDTLPQNFQCLLTQEGTGVVTLSVSGSATTNGATDDIVTTGVATSLHIGKRTSTNHLVKGA